MLACIFVVGVVLVFIIVIIVGDSVFGVVYYFFSAGVFGGGFAVGVGEGDFEVTVPAKFGGQPAIGVFLVEDAVAIGIADHPGTPGFASGRDDDTRECFRGGVPPEIGGEGFFQFGDHADDAR